jgi:hypothetical protein
MDGIFWKLHQKRQLVHGISVIFFSLISTHFSILNVMFRLE